MNLDNVPQELKDRPQWVAWRTEYRDGKATKLPVDARTGRLASSTDPRTWGTVGEAAALVSAGHADGVGFVFTEDDPYCGIDLDDCHDPATGEIDDDALAVVNRFGSYAEWSPSGEGIHVIIKGKPPGGAGRKRGDRECYFAGRFFTVTGQSIGYPVIVEAQYALDAWHAETFTLPPPREKALAHSNANPITLNDSEILRKIADSKQGLKFGKLWQGDTSDYGSGSEADLALCSILSFWCQRDPAAVDRLFRASGLMRPKWDAKRGEQTYGQRTVAKACASGDSYDPEYRSSNLTGDDLVFTEWPPNKTKPAPEAIPTDDVAGILDLEAAGAHVRWLWPEWIQVGVLTAVAAEGGTGKTRFAADLVRRIVHGLAWPDGKPMELEPGPTAALWVVADNHHDEMVTLCKSFGIAERVKVNASKSEPFEGTTLEYQEDYDWLGRRVEATRPLVVVVDTVGNSTDKNLSKQEDAKKYYAPMQKLARERSVAVLCLTHLNAGGKILGRRALEKVRTCIRLSAEKVNDTTCPRRLEVVKSNSQYPPPLGVVMGSDGNAYNDQPPPTPEEREAVATPRAAPKKKECADWLADQLAKELSLPVGPTLTKAEAAGFSRNTVYGAKNLLNLEEVTVNGKKWWRALVA